MTDRREFLAASGVALGSLAYPGLAPGVSESGAPEVGEAAQRGTGGGEELAPVSHPSP